jgi:hypothetical protein
MAYILVNTGSIANSDTADTIREGFHKVNSNFISLNTSGITSSINLAGAAGGSSGLYLPIVINGTTYKIVLNNN